MKSHHKVQQYCCNVCSKKFTQVTSLNQHLQAHAGVTGYYCPRCPEKNFKLQSQLHTHMKTHGQAFPYECSKCDEKFLQQSHLDQHLKMHDEFKFKCDICPSSFNQESLLKKHVQRHVEGRYLNCPVANCAESFAVRQHLSKHLLTNHSHHELPPPKRSKKTTLQSPQQPLAMIGQPLSLQHTTGQRKCSSNADLNLQYADLDTDYIRDIKDHRYIYKVISYTQLTSVAGSWKNWKIRSCWSIYFELESLRYWSRHRSQLRT